MSKNMTRKGLAFGAGLSLIVSGIAGLPANAAGINDDSVSLLPTIGDEFDIIAGADLRLSANMATGVLGTGKYLKFHVADALGKTSVYYTGSTQHSDVASAYTQEADDEKVTLTGLTSHLFKVGDEVEISGADDNFLNTAANVAIGQTTGTPASDGVAQITTVTASGIPQTGDVFSLTISGTTASFTAADNDTLAAVATGLAAAINASGLSATVTAAATSGGALTVTADADNTAFTASLAVTEWINVANVNESRVTITDKTADSITFVGGAISVDTGTVTDDVTVKMLSSTPEDGAYIFDTKSDTNGTDKTIQLSSTDQNVTQTVIVTAWVDSNNDDDIDTTEYASPARTVRFLASTAITPTVTFDPISVGDSTVVAKVTTTPALNGAQLSTSSAYQPVGSLTSAAAALKVEFTRPGTSEVELSASTSYSDVTKQWTATSINMNAAAWSIADATDRSSTSYSITDNVVLMTVNGDHGLSAGDRVVITGSSVTRLLSPTSGATQYSTVLSTPSTTTFTYAELTSASVAATGADVATTATTGGAVASVDVDTDADTKILRDYAVAGSYTAQVQLYRFDASLTDELTDIGTKLSSTVGASVASSETTAPTFAGVGTSTVSVGDGSAAAVKTGTTAANFVLSVFDEDGDAIGAGVAVRVTTTTVTTAGVITVNGTKRITGSSFVTETDANGQVALAVTNTSGAADEAIVLDASVQGVSATQFTATWADASYSIYDTADTSTTSANRNRAVADGGSYTFNLRVLDQWNAPLDGATHRLLVAATQNGVVASTQTVALNAGAASVTVADAGQDGDTSVSVIVQKLVAGVWTSQTTNSDVYADWAGAGSGDLANVVLKYYDQTDAITLNADGASLPSGTLSELDANVTTVALKAADTRFSNEAPNTYPATTKAVVGGKVTNANTGVAKSGAVVTVSAPGVLFNNGGVWAIGSIDVLSNDGTFSVDAYSRVAGETKVTVTHGAVSKDVTVDFNAVGTVDGYTIELSAPSSVPAGSTFRVQGQIKDVNGNGVPLLTAGTGTNPTLKVAYQGLGLVSGSLPTTTDASGNFYFYVLVGSNDKGTGTVTVSYDIDGTSTTNAAVAKSQTIYVGQSAPSDQKVNAGSFKGYVALYAKGYAGQRMSAKVGKDWVVVPALASDFERVVEFTGAGVDVAVRIYIDRVLMDTINLTTK